MTFHSSELSLEVTEDLTLSANPEFSSRTYPYISCRGIDIPPLKKISISRESILKDNKIS
jgi:hypothetical protein